MSSERWLHGIQLGLVSRFVGLASGLVRLVSHATRFSALNIIGCSAKIHSELSALVSAWGSFDIDIYIHICMYVCMYVYIIYTNI